MNNYRRPDKKQKKTHTVDGFLPSTGNLEGEAVGVKKRFATHYRPKNDARSSMDQRRDIGRVASQKEEGFFPRNMQLDTDLGDVDSDELLRATSDLDSVTDDTYRPPGLLGRLRRKKDGKPPQKKDRRKRIARTVAIVFVAFIVALSSIFAYGFIKARRVFRGNGEGAAALDKDVDPSRLNGEGDGRVNILVLGKGGAGHTAPDLTDTLLLASIDPVQNEAALLSVPRDLYVKDSNGYSTKINALYSNAKQASLADGDSDDQAEDAGLTAIKQEVSNVLGVPIHYYVMVDFKAFEDAINTVGGVTIDVKEQVYDVTMAWLNEWNPVIADVGLQTFDGRHALYYARSRYGSSDFARSERQREIIVALQQKVLSSSTLSNPLKLYELLGTFSENVRTDLNGLDEIKRLYEIGQQIGQDRIVSVSLTKDPILLTTDFIDNQSIVRPVAGLYQYDELQSFVRNTLRDAFLKQEDARVVILNGTDTAGLATARQTELLSYGYNIIQVDNAPTSDYVSTRLISLSPDENKYTENYLTKRLGINAERVTIEGLPTAETADFVIILGSDEATRN